VVTADAGDGQPDVGAAGGADDDVARREIPRSPGLHAGDDRDAHRGPGAGLGSLGDVVLAALSDVVLADVGAVAQAGVDDERRRVDATCIDDQRPLRIEPEELGQLADRGGWLHDDIDPLAADEEAERARGWVVMGIGAMER
jgi:hypothetical protein